MTNTLTGFSMVRRESISIPPSNLGTGVPLYFSGDKETFSHREFSFTLEDDIYVRYQSFDSQQSLEEGIRKNQPYKIDIGAIFSVKPSMRNRVQQASFKALRKELVFDIDMTDYDDIRTCCREANICNKCWRFMTIAMKIIDRALRGEKLVFQCTFLKEVP